jgi:hypothetical protein
MNNLFSINIKDNLVWLIQKVLYLRLVIFLLAGWSVFLYAANNLTVKSTIDKTVVGLNKQFTLSVEISGEGANSISDPRLPELSNFAMYLGSGSSQNIQFINGKMSVTKIINYHYRAATAGIFQIKPVVIVYKGKQYQTNPVQIEILKSVSQQQTTQKQSKRVKNSGNVEGDLFLRTIVNKKKVYKNEPVIVTYKIYTRLNISQIGYTSLPSTAGFWAEEFKIPQQPQTSQEILGGKEYTVAVLKKMALFPMSSGQKTIESLGVECGVRIKRKRSRDPFGDFFDDSFFFGRTERKEIFSKPINIEVLPHPEEGKPDNFTGEIGKYTIKSWVDKSTVNTNEAISFKVKIEGQGNIRTLSEPQILFSSDFESYPPKLTEKINRNNAVINGSKTYEYVLVPRIPGKQKIKPIYLSFFDPTEKLYKTIHTDEILIDVKKGKEIFSAIPSGLSKEEVKILGQDIRFIITDTPKFKNIGSAFYNKIFFWFIFVLPLICLGGSIGYRNHRNRLSGDLAYARSIRANHAAKKRLAKAKTLLKVDTQKDFYAETGKALLGYLGDKLNIAEAGIISEDVKLLLRKRGVNEETILYVFNCLEICDMKRFSPSDADIDEMSEFLKKAQNAIIFLYREISR